MSTVRFRFGVDLNAQLLPTNGVIRVNDFTEPILALLTGDLNPA
jgi:hypothetical protein